MPKFHRFTIPNCSLINAAMSEGDIRHIIKSKHDRAGSRRYVIKEYKADRRGESGDWALETYRHNAEVVHKTLARPSVIR